MPSGWSACSKQYTSGPRSIAPQPRTASTRRSGWVQRGVRSRCSVISSSAATRGTDGDSRFLEAGAVIAMIPCMVLYVALQRYYVRGLTSGVVKG
jgi:hypothetical protein